MENNILFWHCSQEDFGKGDHTWKTYSKSLQCLLESYSNQDNVILVKE